jgi:hypothetical protein
MDGLYRHSLLQELLGFFPASLLHPYFAQRFQHVAEQGAPILSHSFCCGLSLQVQGFS